MPTFEIGQYIKSKVTTAPGHDFGLKLGQLYKVVGFPYNTNSGVIMVRESDGCETPWAESYFEAVE